MEKYTLGGANLYLEDESLNAQDFQDLINEIKEIGKSKGFSIQEKQVSSNPLPFGSCGQFPYFQVGKGRGSKRIQFTIMLGKQNYSKSARFRTMDQSNNDNNFYGNGQVGGSIKINNEIELFEALKLMKKNLEEA